ncbi:MAG: glycosyltransferase [Butyrivibrio sp.]|uniref:glycosyltransferase n=1 Tax=Butyrivibrio sp. TaxID=28121 RepID=UPI0025C65E07|nr:glycosyltransferase [Butyrivibrio sp.]MBQ6589706.1 glycosyltransferase [Butyrivibrio sp.]
MISIVVTVYNLGNYIECCLKSIIMQTYMDIEVIVVDDGSTDNSARICDEYAARDSRVKVIHQENSGIVRARKNGLLASRGEYIGFVDGDDWIEPEMYEKLYRALTDENVQVSMCGRIEEMGDLSRRVCQGIEAGRYGRNELLTQVFPRMIVKEGFFEWGIYPGYWDKLFSRCTLEPHLMNEDDRIVMGEDAAGVYPCLLSAESIYIMQDCLYHYRQSSNSMVKKKVADYESERLRFKVLYQSVNEIFSKAADNLLADQWLLYVLFLMIPRADVLYAGIEKLDYLFPFPEVKRGERVIIYGAGLYGTRLYRYLKDTGFCDVVAIADRDYARLKDDDMNVISPEEIDDHIYDAVVVASSYQHTRDAIIADLNQKLKCNRIYGFDMDEVLSERTRVAFGLNQTGK